MQKGRFIYSASGFSLTLVLTGLITASLISGPFSGFYLLSAALFFLPFYMQLVLRIAGPLSALAALSLFCFGTGLRFGSPAALFALAYLAVPAAVYAWCLKRAFPAQKAMLMIGLCYAATVLALYALSFRVLGEAPFEALSRLTVDSLRDMPERDGLLMTAYRFGLLSIPQEMAENAVIQSPQGGAMLSSEVLGELYKQIGTRASLYLRALVPSLISSLGPWLATGGVYMSDFYGKRQAHRRAFRQPEGSADAQAPQLKGLPPFHRFFIPKQLASPLWAAGALSLLTRLSGQDALALAGAMLYNIFFVFFSLQGISALNFMQRRRNVRPWLRALSIAAAVLLLPHAALVLGMFDQLSDQRKLRRPDADAQSDKDTTNNHDTGRE